MPVVIQSQNRKKWLAMGCKSSARWAWQRWRYTVTPMIVTCVTASANKTICHHDKRRKPCARKSRRELSKVFYPYCSDARTGCGCRKDESWLSKLNGILLQPLQVFVTKKIFCDARSRGCALFTDFRLPGALSAAIRRRLLKRALRHHEPIPCPDPPRMDAGCIVGSCAISTAPLRAAGQPPTRWMSRRA